MTCALERFLRGGISRRSASSCQHVPVSSPIGKRVHRLTSASAKMRIADLLGLFTLTSELKRSCDAADGFLNSKIIRLGTEAEIHIRARNTIMLKSAKLFAIAVVFGATSLGSTGAFAWGHGHGHGHGWGHGHGHGHGWSHGHYRRHHHHHGYYYAPVVPFVGYGYGYGHHHHHHH